MKPKYVVAKIPRVSIERLRDAVAGAQEREPRMTLAWALARALRSVRMEIEDRYNGGRPFPKRETQLPRGRRKSPEAGERVFEVEAE